MQYSNKDRESRTEELVTPNETAFGKAGKTTIAAPITLSDLNFEQALRQYPLLVVDFFAPWCGPCRALAPMIEQMASEMAGQAVFGKLDVDKNPRVASLFGVQSIPTIIMFKDGQLVDGFRGVVPKDEIKSMIRIVMSLSE